MKSVMPKTLLPVDHDKEAYSIYVQILCGIKLDLTIGIRASSLSDHRDIKEKPFDLDL